MENERVMYWWTAKILEVVLYVCGFAGLFAGYKLILAVKYTIATAGNPHFVSVAAVWLGALGILWVVAASIESKLNRVTLVPLSLDTIRLYGVSLRILCVIFFILATGLIVGAVSQLTAPVFSFDAGRLATERGAALGLLALGFFALAFYTMSLSRRR